MEKKVFILCFSVLLFLHNHAEAKFPIHLGGFTLGDDIKNYHHIVNMETCREVPFNKYLAEGEIIARSGFKSGLITYGLCDAPNKILRIKLKFADSSKSFFNKLLRQYEKELGSPTEYRGDPFQTMIAWKWSFVKDKNEKISLILQHNTMVEDEKIGNAVKLTLTSQIEKERNCFMTRFPEKEKPQVQPKMSKKDLWGLFVPY